MAPTMRLISRFSLQLFGFSTLLIALHIFFVRWWQVDQLEHASSRELKILGKSVQTAFESAIRHHDRQEMTELFDQLEHTSPLMDFVLFDQQGKVLIHSQNETRADARFADLLSDKRRDGDDGFIRFYHNQTPRDALLIIPVLVSGEDMQGYLGISMPLSELEDEIDGINRANLLLLLALLIFNIVAGIFLGRTYLTAPLDELAGALERIGQGDLSVRLEVKRKDEIGRLLGLVNDLSIELERSRDELEQQMNERQLLLTALRHRDRLASVGQMAAGLAHEIGSPLQVLVGRTRSLSRHAHDPQKINQLSEIIAAQIERIGRIVERMLSFARPTLAIPTASAAPEPSVRQVLELLNAEIARARQTILYTSTPQAEQAKCLVEPDAIQQIVFNLVSNASQWSPPNAQIQVSCALEPWPGQPHAPDIEAFCLSVYDPGAGMDQETLDRLFELFFTKRQEQGGSGLGMPIVRSIVLQHQGYMDCVSAPAQGTCVKVWFVLSD